jgi:hypothetical protein
MTAGHHSAMLDRTIGAPGRLKRDIGCVTSDDLAMHRDEFDARGAQHMALRRTFRIMRVVPPLLIAAACVPQNNATKVGAGSAADLTAPQPRTATYNCAGGGTMTIENFGTSVRVVGPDGASQDLPASPANQSSRFGAAHDAIVIDGRDALVMKGGVEPLTCTR